MGGACSTYEEMRGAYRVLGGDLRETNNLQDLGINWRIILKWIVSKWDVGVWTGSSWHRIGTCGGHL